MSFKVKNILVATNRLSKIGGSETFTYTLIEELIRRQEYHIEYFTLEKGFLSEKIENELGIGFFSKRKYDLILANHNTCVQELYKYGFIIQTCHGIFPELEQPHPKANGYVSISQEVQNHLADIGYPSKLIYNMINLSRFYPKNEINDSPKKILSLCHSEKANGIIKDVCKDLGLVYLEAYKYGNPIWNVEDLINDADLVFGLGRSAYEALACGRPVIVFDSRGYFPSYGDGYLRGVLGLSLLNNCSGRYSKKEFLKDDLIKEVLKYSSEDQNFFYDFAQKELDVIKNIDKYFDYYLKLKKINKNRRIDVILKRKVLKYILKLKFLVKKKLKSILTLSNNE
ncbi:UDP-glycosyltransferase [uncultured Algibacter sp.]|uniref:UDP-glycosyltransferase n=1 Tax=uncultured Algibacter sp. TaxID=298659 RepID=UPI00261A90D5|nr:UDP-glycosyltransferase [uncultured Algibacter sp.]